MYAVARDPFARGEYERECHSNSDQSLDCQWCGQRPTRLYTYQWVNDGSPAPDSQLHRSPSIPW